MLSELKTVLRGVGLVMHVPGLMALVSIPIALLFSEPYTVWPFVWTALISFSIGQLLYRVFRNVEDASLDKAMIIAALGWLAVSVIGAIPFYLTARHDFLLGTGVDTVLLFRDPWNALFESFSGFTSTGLSVATDASKIPRSLQWWRSFTEWVGGAGILLLILSLVSTGSMFRLYYSETRTDRLLPSISSTARTIFWIYLLFTAFAVLLLRVTGIPWWEALNHGMTGIATGGFGITGSSMSEYSVASKLATMLIMIIGAVSFSIHYKVITGRKFGLLWNDIQHRVLWFALVLGPLAVIFENVWFDGSYRWVDSAFQWVSALTTTGFSTVTISEWSVTTHLILVVGMIVGGAAGSTVGGIKIVRAVYLFKGVHWRFKRIELSPHQVIRYEVNGKAISAEEAARLVESASVLVLLWLMSLGAASFVLLHIAPEQYAFSDIVFEVASAQGNVGLSVGITSADLDWQGKCVLMLCMYLGRLEIVPLFIVGSRILYHVLNLKDRWGRKIMGNR